MARSIRRARSFREVVRGGNYHGRRAAGCGGDRRAPAQPTAPPRTYRRRTEEGDIRRRVEIATQARRPGMGREPSVEQVCRSADHDQPRERTAAALAAGREWHEPEAGKRESIGRCETAEDNAVGPFHHAEVPIDHDADRRPPSRGGPEGWSSTHTREHRPAHAQRCKARDRPGLRLPQEGRPGFPRLCCPPKRPGEERPPGSRGVSARAELFQDLTRPKLPVAHCGQRYLTCLVGGRPDRESLPRRSGSNDRARPG